MSRNLGLPYRASNPRTVRGAKKRGWTVVDVSRKAVESNVSWLGLSIWADNYLKGYWVNSFFLHQFAFENPADATAFQLKWG